MIKIPGTIPITIYPFFWLLAIAIGWINTFNFLGTSLWVLIIFVSVLVHEFGHALTANFFGQTARISLIATGGLTERHGGKTKLWQDFIIVFLGPLAGFFLGLFALLLKNTLIAPGSTSVAAYLFTVTFYVNMFWTVINLVPVQPLDGGKLLTIILQSILGVRGIKISLFVSMILAALLGIFFFAFNAVIAGVIFMMLAFEGYRSWKGSLTTSEQDQNLVLQHLLKEAERDLSNGYKDLALVKLTRLQEMAQSGVIYLTAIEHAAQLLAEKGDVKEAYAYLKPNERLLSPQSLQLLHKLAFQQGKWEEAVKLGTLAYQQIPDYETALTNALCLSILGEAPPAIGWLQCAIKAGLPHLQEILRRKEFDNIRSDPMFQKLKQ